jgi:hypothetical protein
MLFNLYLYAVLITLGISRYLFNILLWIDQGLNVVFLGGDPDETISSVIGKFYKYHPFLAWLRKVLNTLDEDHTEKSREDDEGQNSVWAVVARKKAQLILKHKGDNHA